MEHTLEEGDASASDGALAAVAIVHVALATLWMRSAGNSAHAMPLLCLLREASSSFSRIWFECS